VVQLVLEEVKGGADDHCLMINYLLPERLQNPRRKESEE
jgi:hypothetical protein